MLEKFILAFIPLFVAVNAISIIPVFILLAEGSGKKERLTMIVQSMATATCLTVGFVLLGKAVFRTLGITVADFMVAGGILLFAIAIMDVISPALRKRLSEGEAGIVPLGTPLIAGPALLTTSLMMLESHGLGITVAAVLANLMLAGLFFFFAEKLVKIIGSAGTRAISKITSLLLAAIAIMMVRKGILMILAFHGQQ